VLVIDDLHLIYDADWIVPFFHRLLLLLPAKTHMLILGRSLPPEPIWRLRSKQRLFVITEQMLALVIMELGQSISIDDQMSGLFATEPTGTIQIMSPA
jgi:ATP/maltotriose-dependent transcriptional regulator MalT